MSRLSLTEMTIERTSQMSRSEMTDEIDDLAQQLVEGGWVTRPKSHHGFTSDEQAIADALLSDWSERKPETETQTFEWYWTQNTLGRRWEVARVIDGRRFAVMRGFDQRSLSETIKSLRGGGNTVHEGKPPERKVAISQERAA